MNKGTVVTLVFFGALVYLSWTLILTGAKYECDICMMYNNKKSCQKVQGVERDDTIQQGISTACGGVANGMTETMDCQGVPPVKLECKRL